MSHRPDQHLSDQPQVAKAANPDENFKILCHIQRSIRYHKARERFFHSWANAFTFLGLISGSGVVVSLLSSAPQAVSLTFGAIVAVSQALELVVQTGTRARTHNGLASEFSSIERMLVMREKPSSHDLRELQAQILTIEAREPPVKRYLDLICHNQVALAHGSDDTEKLSWFQWTFANWLSGDTALQNPKAPPELKATRQIVTS